MTRFGPVASRPCAEKNARMFKACSSRWQEFLNRARRRRILYSVGLDVPAESMSQVPIWFERKFEFSFPVELYPNLLARLRGTAARLEEALRGPSHETLTAKPEQKWSAQEHAGHLLDLEPLWLARVRDFVAASEQLTATDLQNRKTDQANHNARPPEMILKEFRAAREILLQQSAKLDVSLFSQAIPHPRLKTPMRLVDHLYFVAEHDDHHLARIWELLYSKD